ncbi:MAG: hypothetical protein JJD98_00120 [Polaromonas sp.]|nr:hypothetical protein [Polaromonas sp.]
MSKELIFKLGQLAGAVFMIAGVASCQMRSDVNYPTLFLIGGLLYGGSRMAAWLAPKK